MFVNDPRRSYDIRSLQTIFVHFGVEWFEIIGKSVL